MVTSCGGYPGLFMSYFLFPFLQMTEEGEKGGEEEIQTTSDLSPKLIFS